MLDRLYVGVSVNCVCSWHIANCVKRVGEGFSGGYYDVGCCYGQCWCAMVSQRSYLVGMVL